ncbi:MAG: hypothetical protein MHM6MM_005732, partial [Cercozoa sp. M6MM]
QWGHDFRPAYAKILDGVDRKQVPVVALTATAPSPVRNDIAKHLSLRSNALILKGALDRSNIFYDVRTRSGIASDLPVSLFRGVSSIVYVWRKKDCGEVVNHLRSIGISARAFHASLSAQERKQVAHNFNNDTLQCVVATVAFGMGIDKSDIRLVMHWGPPASLEHFYQESGRAGRDGIASKSIVLTSRMEESTLLQLKHGEHRAKFERCLHFLSDATRCRRRRLLSALGNETDPQVPPHRCCDVCAAGPRPVKDVTEDMRILVQCVRALNERYGRSVCVRFIFAAQDALFTLAQTINVTKMGTFSRIMLTPTGRKLANNASFKLDPVPVDDRLLGRDRSMTNTTARKRMRLEISSAVPQVNPQEDSTAERAPKLQKTRSKKLPPAQDIELRYQVHLNNRAESEPLARDDSVVELLEDDIDWQPDLLEMTLLERLQSTRRSLTKESSVDSAPYLICPEPVLRLVARTRPSNVLLWQRLQGVPSAGFLIEKVAPKLQKVLDDFCKENELERDCFDFGLTLQSDVPSEATMAWRVAQVTPTKAMDQAWSMLSSCSQDEEPSAQEEGVDVSALVRNKLSRIVSKLRVSLDVVQNHLYTKLMLRPLYTSFEIEPLIDALWRQRHLLKVRKARFKAYVKGRTVDMSDEAPLLVGTKRAAFREKVQARVEEYNSMSQSDVLRMCLVPQQTAHALWDLLRAEPTLLHDRKTFRLKADQVSELSSFQLHWILCTFVAFNSAAIGGNSDSN